MKNNRKKVINFTSITEYKSLEKYLERKALEGLMLIGMKRNSLIFEKTTPLELNFNVSLFYHTTPFDYPDDEKVKDYRQLCEESGWKFSASNDIYQIFYKEKDAEIVPIHTDPQEEYEIIKNTLIKTDLISLILMLLMIGMGCIHILNFNYEKLFTNTALFTVLSPVFLMIIVIAIYVPQIMWLLTNRKRVANGQDLAFSTDKVRIIRNSIMWSLIGIYFILAIFSVVNVFSNPFLGILVFMPILISTIIAKYCVKRFKTKKHTRRHNIIFLSVILVLTTIIISGGIMTLIGHNVGFGENNDRPKKTTVLELSDFGTLDEPERIRTYERSSIFIPLSIEYYESLGRKAKDNEVMTVRTHYIQCKNNAIADYVFDGYMDEERDRMQRRIDEYQEYGDIEKAKEEEKTINDIFCDLWNVDRGYYLSSNKSRMIIQKDNTLYILDSDVDFSKEEIIEICKDKLKL